jgi:hypothetical protein
MTTARSVTQVFLSHTRLDEQSCAKFDSLAARVGLKVFRSELETIEAPAWKTIQKEINSSAALFLLVGPELVKAQAASETNITSREEWKYTQNWISYEVGVGCQRGIDVWVVCDQGREREINFPVPYLNNYTVHGLDLTSTRRREFMKWVFAEYQAGRNHSLRARPYRNAICPYENCGAMFNLHSVILEGRPVVCPTCLNKFTFKTKWSPVDREKAIRILAKGKITGNPVPSVED